MNDWIYQLEQDIKNNVFDNKSLLDIHCGLGFLQDAIAKAFIKKLNNEEPLSSEEILIIFDYLCLDDISAIECEIDVLVSITSKAENENKIKESVYFYNLIDSYRKAVNTIVVYYSCDSARFDSDIAFLAKECCERICKISNTDENKLFYKNAMKELAEAYVQHIEYCRSYETGYWNEDYLNWYEEVLDLDPDNITALKEKISLKSLEEE